MRAPAPPEAQAYKTGVELIHRALNDLVRKRGVVPIETVGADFDPHRHQAVAQAAHHAVELVHQSGSVVITQELAQPLRHIR